MFHVSIGGPQDGAQATGKPLNKVQVELASILDFVSQDELQRFENSVYLREDAEEAEFERPAALKKPRGRPKKSADPAIQKPRIQSGRARGRPRKHPVPSFDGPKLLHHESSDGDESISDEFEPFKGHSIREARRKPRVYSLVAAAGLPNESSRDVSPTFSPSQPRHCQRRTSSVSSRSSSALPFDALTRKRKRSPSPDILPISEPGKPPSVSVVVSRSPKRGLFIQGPLHTKFSDFFRPKPPRKPANAENVLSIARIETAGPHFSNSDGADGLNKDVVDSPNQPNSESPNNADALNHRTARSIAEANPGSPKTGALDGNEAEATDDEALFFPAPEELEADAVGRNDERTAALLEADERITLPSTFPLPDDSTSPATNSLVDQSLQMDLMQNSPLGKQSTSLFARESSTSDNIQDLIVIEPLKRSYRASTFTVQPNLKNREEASSEFF